MEIETEVFYWTATGMRARSEPSGTVGYIPVREVERLLEEAYQRGYDRGCDDADMGLIR